MASPLENLMATAYHADQVGHDRAGAINLLKSAITDNPDMKTAMQEESARLRAVVSARTAGARCGCHISKVLSDLLTAALS